ncbi:MAG: hypothetical protein AAFY11_05525 [Cyanobacteria bacterium J06641_5]
MYGKQTTLSAAIFFLLCSPIALGQVKEVFPQKAIASPEIETAVAANELSGWKRFIGGDIELWLPESFEGGDLVNDIDVAISRLKSLGPQFAQLARLVEANRDAYSLIAIDSEIGPSGNLTNVLVGSERVISTLTLENYLDAIESSFPPPLQVVERDVVSLQRYRAGRLVVETPLNPSVTVKQTIYGIKVGNTIWTIAYSTGIDEFEQRLPIFEKSIETFAVQE